MNTHLNLQSSENYLLPPTTATKRPLDSDTDSEEAPLHQLRRTDLGSSNLTETPFPRSDIRSFFPRVKTAAILMPSSDSDKNSPKTTSDEKDSDERSSPSSANVELSSHSASATQRSTSRSDSSITEPEVLMETNYDSDKTISEQSYDGTATDTAAVDFFSDLTPSASTLETATPFVSPWSIDDTLELSSEIKEIPPTLHPAAYLTERGVACEKLACGHGSCGKVYNATIAGSSTPFLYKVEMNPTSLGNKPHRLSDLAAGRLDDLPHIVKPLFVILQLRTAPNAPLRSFYVPLNKAKEFGSALPAGSQVRILSQIVPKAPGKNLEQFLSSGEISFDPKSPHFRAVLLGVCKFLKNAYPHNFIHRDLKPENIMYDPITKTVTIIDTGLSLRLQRRDKTELPKGISNPPSSKQLAGTLDYMSPFVRQENSYGSEIDFHSTAMMLLSLISNNDFEVVSKRRLSIRNDNTLVDVLFLAIKPERFLADYLSFLGPQSVTAKTLAANPDIKKIIELAFQISAGGDEGKTALKAFEKLPYFTTLT